MLDEQSKMPPKTMTPNAVGMAEDLVFLILIAVACCAGVYLALT